MKVGRWIFPLLSGWGLSILLCLSQQSCWASETLVQRFYTEYPAAQKRLAEAYRHAEALAIVNRPKDLRIPRDERMLNIYTQGDLKKVDMTDYRVESTTRKEVKYDFVYCLGPTYRFELTRLPNRAYALGQFHKNSSDTTNPFEPVGLNFNRTAGNFLFAASQHPTLDLKLLLDRQVFRILEADEFREDGQSVVRLKFVGAASSDDTAGGTIMLLPDRGWALRYMEYQNRGVRTDKTRSVIALHSTLNIQYGGDQAGVPLLKSVYYKGGISSVGTSVDFDRLTLGTSTSERDFELAHYHIPDLSQPPTDPTRSNLTPYLFAAGTVSLVGAWLLRRRA